MSASAPTSEQRRRRIRNSVPAAYLRTMLEISAEHGVAPERVLEGTHLSLSLLETPELRIPAQTAAGVCSARSGSPETERWASSSGCARIRPRTAMSATRR